MLFHLSFAHPAGHQCTAAGGDHRADGKRDGKKRPGNADGGKRIRPQKIGHEKLITSLGNLLISMCFILLF